ncbi:MAG: DNA repair protein RecO [Chloroherpetonaceae bacterium]
MITKTDAIVLRSIDYRDQSKILTLYTKDFGRMSAIAKGARSTQSKFASALEVGSHISMVLYKKSTRDIQNISDASLKTSFFTLTESLEKLSAMHQILELVRLCTEDDEPNLKIFNLLLETLNLLNQFKANALNLVFYFQIKLISHLGFTPSFKECVVSGKPILSTLETHAHQDLLLVPDLGGIAIREEAIAQGVSGRLISVEAYRLIEQIATTTPRDLESLALPPKFIGELSTILDAYFRYHIEDLPPLRSREVFSQIARSNGES